ncbi:CD63 antigen isoform X2 [Cryptotermes secundus]|uniref:CD63 antigen isoform X2 n=1 Tax=Cryptotermes secundus TaxID=105785 RepID=UPI000CD7CCD1|nr:CD63 antigen isoform X2 [Cryptotermes secundus]
MGCGITTVKYLLFIFNLVFALCGLAILIAGALSYANIDRVDNHLHNVDVSGSPIALIVVGSIVFIVAFYGCCGAIRESHCMVVTFAVFLLVILITEIAIGIVAFVNRDGWNTAIHDSLTDMFGRYDQDEAIKKDINSLQKALECCGIDGPDYWKTSIPEGCCVNPDGTCSAVTDPKQVFQEGCVQRLEELIHAIGLLLGVLAIVIGIVEIIGVVFALCLASSIKNKDRRVY